MDLDTREWFDGVLTAAARKVVKEPPEVSNEICKHKIPKKRPRQLMAHGCPSSQAYVSCL